MSEAYQGGGGGHGGFLPFYHVPQQSRREKLRYPANEDHQPPPPPSSCSSFFPAPPPSLPSSLYTSHNAPPPPPPPPPPLYMGIPSPSPSPSSLPSSSSSYLLNPNYSAPPPPSFDTSPFDHPFFPNHNHYQAVSLSLSSHHQSHDTMRDPRLGVGGACGGVMEAVSRAPAPSEPFTGYAAVLKNSRYLRPAKQMLEEICDAGGRSVALVCADSDPIEADLSVPDGLGGGSGDGPGGGGEQRRMKTRLISMLDEVYRRYKQYYQQIQAVVTSFESVAGLNNAAPYTCLALKSMSKHFQTLKYAISEQLRCADRSHGKEGHSKEGLPGFGLTNGGFCYQGASHSSGAVGQQHVWRPQRGLPERAVAVLKAWLFEHFLHPYPTDTDKHMLAKQTGLSRNQVSNWFINARVRLWKPLVEEIHSLEMRQGHKNSNADSNNGANGHPHPQPASSTERQSNKQPMQNSIGSHTPPQKRFRDEFDDIPNQIVGETEPLSFGFDDFTSHHRIGTASSGIGGISLTLGLHQNNGSICLSDQLPLNIARRFGIEESGAAYGMGGFDVQDRHFGKEIDGQLLHDFVG